MKNLLFIALLTVGCTAVLSAQPRPVEKTAAPVPANAPTAYAARYEGGVFGASSKETGTLKLDDVNERVIFLKKDQKEMFSIPYSALLVIYPDTKVAVSKTGNVVSRLPLPGAGLAGLINSSTKYLIVNFDDPDIDAKGTANFKFDDKDKLVDFINALGQKAKMKQRGDAYYRAKTGPVY
ncbi:MAG: hypothetical protein ABJB40_03485 [Acidobacteriota bacterium]